MGKKQKRWMRVPAKQPKPKVPEDIKKDMEIKATDLIESFLKPTYIKSPPKNEDFNYI